MVSQAETLVRRTIREKDGSGQALAPPPTSLPNVLVDRSKWLQRLMLDSVLGNCLELTFSFENIKIITRFCKSQCKYKTFPDIYEKWKHLNWGQVLWVEPLVWLCVVCDIVILFTLSGWLQPGGPDWEPVTAPPGGHITVQCFVYTAASRCLMHSPEIIWSIKRSVHWAAPHSPGCSVGKLWLCNTEAEHYYRSYILRWCAIKKLS